MKTNPWVWLLGGAALLVAFAVVMLYRPHMSPSPERQGGAAPVAAPQSSLEPAAAEPLTPEMASLASDAGLGPLPDLPVDAEQFVRSEANPFRCLRDAGLACSAESDDPMIARSPAEARWMMDQGYPETALREKVAGWSSTAIRQEAERSGSMALALLALEQQAKEVLTPEEAEAVADQIGRWSVERERQLGRAWGGTYPIVSQAKALAQAYTLAEAKEKGSGRPWAVASARAGFEALVLGETLAFGHIQPFFWGGVDEFMSFSNARIGLSNAYDQMRMNAYSRSRGFSGSTVSDIRIRPVPELREVQTADGRTIRRWYGEP